MLKDSRGRGDQAARGHPRPGPGAGLSRGARFLTFLSSQQAGAPRACKGLACYRQMCPSDGKSGLGRWPRGGEGGKESSEEVEERSGEKKSNFVGTMGG